MRRGRSDLNQDAEVGHGNGAVLAWLCKEGDPVQKGAPIVQIETDKVTYEIETLASGTLRKILAHEKEVMTVGDYWMFITAEGEVFDDTVFNCRHAWARNIHLGPADG